MHPLCKGLQDVISNALEGIGLSLEYPGSALLCSSAPPTDIFLSQVHALGGMHLSSVAGTGFLEIIDCTLLAEN